MTPLVLEAVVQRCPKCGHEFTPDEAKTCWHCHSSICPKCDRCLCVKGLFDNVVFLPDIYV